MGHIRVITAAKVLTLLTLCTATDGILGHFSHYFCLCKIRLPLKIIAKNFRLPFKIMMLCTVFRLDVCADADCGRSRSGGEHHCHHSLVKVRPTSSSEADVTIIFSARISTIASTKF